MTPETLEALKASIAKWERNAVAETPSAYRTRPDDCPLCNLFQPPEGEYEDACIDCPVMLVTKARFCSGTPYYIAATAHYDWRGGADAKDRAHAAARDEVAFLKSLLPQGEEAAS